MTTFLWIVLGIVIILGFWLVGVYNSLVSLKIKTDEALSDIDVQTKRRYDLIPNLVETVKGYASHESGVFEKVTNARAAAMGAQNLHDKAAAENMLSETLKSLFAVAENYPELKANVNFLDLQKNLTEIEEHVQASRRFYNGMVRDLNTRITQFPAVLVAEMLGFKAREFFEAEEASKQNVAVKF
jgi:LemA protein